MARRSVQLLDALPLRFEANQGQAPRDVRFVARSHRYSTLFEESRVTFLLEHLAPRMKRATAFPGMPHPASQLRRDTLTMKLVGANSAAPVYGIHQLRARTNYLLGDDPAEWHTHIPNYRRVRYQDVYPRSDLVFYGTQGKLEYDFRLRPGGEPGRIALRFGGARNLRLTPSGDLILETSAGRLVFHKPAAYQEVHGRRRSIESQFRLVAGREVKFEVGAYDRTRTLTIDPVLTFSTYLGGSGTDEGHSIAVDSSGVYVAGSTTSTDFPATTGAYQTASQGSTDIFVAKLNPAGTTLLYATYLGGLANDFASHIAVDAGSAILTGLTASSDFPTSAGAYQTSLKGTNNAFVTKLTADGSGLVFSTYLGGSGTDYANSLYVDGSGNVYLTGVTYSADFPVMGAIQSTLNGGSDAFVTEINSAGTGLVYSTFLGGSGNDGGAGIAGDGTGAVYVAGSTSSDDFPTATPFQAQRAGSSDVFVAKIAAGGGSLVYSSYLGGTGNDQAADIAADSSGFAYVTGTTTSTDFQIAAPLQSTLGGGTDGFVAKIGSSGAGLVYSTYLGGTGTDQPNAIAVDSSGDVYVTGQTYSADFPTATPIQKSLLPNGDAFVSVFNPAGSALTFSTFLGGTGADNGDAIALDAAGDIYLAGITGSTGFPIIQGDVQTSSGGGSDAWVARIAPSDAPGVSLLTNSLTFNDQSVNTISVPQIITLRNVGTGALGITSIVATGDFSQTNGCFTSVAGASACGINVTFTPTARGSRTGTLTITDNAAGSPRTINLSGKGIEPAVTLSASSLTFDKQNIGTTSTAQTLTLTNTGVDPLGISGVAVVGDFAQTNDCGTSVAAGASCTFQVTFRPTKALDRSGSLTIVDNAPGSPRIVQLSGTGEGPDVQISPASLSFANQPVGTTSGAQTITLTNDGNAALNISAITLTGDFVQTNDCGTSLDTGATCTFTVTFKSTTAGTTFGSITVTDDAPGSPHVIPLTGNAVSGTAPVAYLSPSSISYDLQPVGTKSATQAVTLQNTGNSDLTVSKVDAGTAGFTQTNNCATVAAGASCTITVTFAPTLRGLESIPLSVTDDASDSPQSIVMSGTGTDFGMSGDPPSVTVNSGSPANYTVTLTPLNGYNSVTKLTCDLKVQSTTCTLTPSSVTPDGTNPSTVKVAVVTTQRSTGALPPLAKGPGGWWPLAGSPSTGTLALLLVALALVGAGAFLAGRRRRASWVLFGVVLSLLLCGGCNVGAKITGTPQGNFPVTLTATTTTSSGDTLSHTLTLVLNVN